MQGLFDTSPYDLLPAALKTPETQALGYAVQRALERMLEYSWRLSLYSDLGRVPDEILDALALELRTQYYDQSASREIREAMVRQTLAWYMQGGTKSVLEEYLSLLHQGGYVEEWFDYGGDPYFFRATVRIDEDEEIEIGESGGIIRQIYAYKNVRSWLEAFAFELITEFMVPVRFESQLGIRWEYYPRANIPPLYLDGTWLLNGDHILTGWQDEEIDWYPVTLWIQSQTEYQLEINSSLTVEKDLWYLDGTYGLDGEKMLDADVIQYDLKEGDKMAKGKATVILREKLCQAHAGDRTLPKITHMAFGRGGIGPDGEVLDVTGEETAMGEELLRKEIEKREYLIGTTCRYRVRLTKEELAGEYISEQALFDAEGDMVAYKTFLPKGKDDDMEFIFDMDEVF